MREPEDYFVVYLPASLWNAIQIGDAEAIEKGREMLDKKVIYNHVFIAPEEWGGVVEVSLAELEAAKVIRSITLHREIV